MARRFLINALTAIISIVVFFGIAEIATRLLWKYEAKPPHIGVILEGTNRTIVHQGVEYRTNNLGLRMRKDVPPEKPEGVLRILVLGDSYVFGDGLPYEDLVTVKIEENVSGGSKAIEVLNGGVCGFNTSDELAHLKRLAPACEPDMVIVFFYTNDVQVKRSDSIAAGHEDIRNLRYDRSWQLRFKEYLRKKSKFFAYLYYLYRDKLAAYIGAPKAFLPPEYTDLNDTKPGWVAFKSAAAEMREFCDSNDLDLLFVMIPTLIPMRKNYLYNEVRTETAQYLASRDIPVIDLFDVFKNYNPSKLWISPENTHWNGLATSLAADEVSTYIRKHRLIEKKR